MRSSSSSGRAPTTRRGPGWVPNQHGAWAMLAIPLLVGVLASGPAWIHLPLAAFWFVGYFAFFATGLWLKSSRRARYLPPVRVHGLTAAVLGAAVLALDGTLALWIPVFVVRLGIGLWSSARRTDRSLVSGLSTTVGSALMTVVAYDAGGGQDWLRAGVLAAVQAAYFAGTVFYVQSLIRERGNQAFARAGVAFHAACVVLAAGASFNLIFAFLIFTLGVRLGWPDRATVAEVVAGSPTLLQVDLKLSRPISPRRVELLEDALRPLEGRLVVGSQAHWNLRRLSGVPVALDPTLHWAFAARPPGIPPALGVHGLWDDSPIASNPRFNAYDYVHARVDDLLSLVLQMDLPKYLHIGSGNSDLHRGASLQPLILSGCQPSLGRPGFCCATSFQ